MTCRTGAPFDLVSQLDARGLKVSGPDSKNSIGFESERAQQVFLGANRKVNMSHGAVQTCRAAGERENKRTSARMPAALTDPSSWNSNGSLSTSDTAGSTRWRPMKTR